MLLHSSCRNHNEQEEEEAEYDKMKWLPYSA